MNFSEFKIKSIDLLMKIFYSLLRKSQSIGWLGNFSTWEEAKTQCTGYDDVLILEKVKTSVLKVKNGEAVYERDSVLFDKIEYSNKVLDVFNIIIKENDGELAIIDFGGSLGSCYFQYRNLLSNLKKINWNVVEQKHFVDCGNKYIKDENLVFYYSINEVLAEKNSNVLFLSGVIQYLEKPYEFINKILHYNFEYIIFDRTAFIENEKDRITIQYVPKNIYKASYPAWFLNEQHFLSLFSQDYNLINEFISEITLPIKLTDGSHVYWKGFIFKRIINE
jgi:putative methyltransferase (TIGR04325 family)